MVNSNLSSASHRYGLTSFRSDHVILCRLAALMTDLSESVPLLILKALFKIRQSFAPLL